MFTSGFSESDIPDAVAESRKEAIIEERPVSRHSSNQNEPDSEDEDYFSDEDIDMVHRAQLTILYCVHYL